MNEKKAPRWGDEHDVALSLRPIVQSAFGVEPFFVPHHCWMACVERSDPFFFGKGTPRAFLKMLRTN